LSCACLAPLSKKAPFPTLLFAVPQFRTLLNTRRAAPYQRGRHLLKETELTNLERYDKIFASQVLCRAVQCPTA